MTLKMEVYIIRQRENAVASQWVVACFFRVQRRCVRVKKSLTVYITNSAKPFYTARLYQASTVTDRSPLLTAYIQNVTIIIRYRISVTHTYS